MNLAQHLALQGFLQCPEAVAIEISGPRPLVHLGPCQEDFNSFLERDVLPLLPADPSLAPQDSGTFDGCYFPGHCPADVASDPHSVAPSLKNKLQPPSVFPLALPQDKPIPSFCHPVSPLVLRNDDHSERALMIPQPEFEAGE
jgi:hypothetical protein